MKATPKSILVIYVTRDRYPLKNTITTHLYAFERYSNHRVYYVNLCFGLPFRLMKRVKFDVILFHTTFLGSRWNLEAFQGFMQGCQVLKDYPAYKIAMPQDEFIQTDSLNDFINDFGVHIVLTCAEAEDWPKIYNRVDREAVRFKTVLTGYLDEKTLKKIDRVQKTQRPRRIIDISYRAWKAEYNLGEHGMHKVWVAEETLKRLKYRTLNTDISLSDKDVLVGDDWFIHLLSSRSVIGVQGGASVLDHDQAIQKKVVQYVKAHPQATFEETREACFPGRDYELRLACISPRHLEACATQTCQILIEGRFNDILRPWIHYLPIQPNYANLDELLDLVEHHPEKLEAIAKQAYIDVVKSGRFTYRSFMSELDDKVLNGLSPYYYGLLQHGNHLWFKLRDYLCWQVVQYEVLNREQSLSWYKKLWYGVQLTLVKAFNQKLQIQNADDILGFITHAGKPKAMISIDKSHQQLGEITSKTR